jgi:hypothetical protein
MEDVLDALMVALIVLEPVQMFVEQKQDVQLTISHVLINAILAQPMFVPPASPGGPNQETFV